MQWNIPKSYPFAVCTFFLNFVTTPAFFPNHWWSMTCSHTWQHRPCPPIRVIGENVICCCGVLHRNQLQELLGDSLIYTINGQFHNIRNVYTLIKCNQKFNKWLDFVLQLPVQVCRKIWNLICHSVSHQVNVGKNLSLFRAYNFYSLQYECFTNLPS